MVRSTLPAAAPSPAPLTDTARLGLAGSLLATASEAEAATVATGAYRTVTSADFPLATVKGVAGDTMLNTPAPPLIAETTMSAAPTLLTVNFESFVWPTVTAPKSRLDGAREVAGEGTLPNPVIATVSDERVGSLLKIERFEATDPTPLGANRTVTSTDCPAGIVVGSAGDTML